MPDYDEAGTGRSAPRGRPRSREVHERILDAAIASLAETGVEKLSIEAVAQRAGVGKTSIYRRWSRKEDLVADALERLKPPLGTPTRGELREDMFELAHGFAQSMNNPLGKQMLSVLVSALSGSSEISELYWQKHSLPKTKEIAEWFERYRRKEPLREDANLEVVAEFLIGFIMYQLLMKPASADLEDRLNAGIDLILNGIRQPPARNDGGPRAIGSRDGFALPVRQRPNPLLHVQAVQPLFRLRAR
ncbi:TetR/AcrR family transcriptional regulator [Cohnella massiliensis]|uniref:TetR/AcrR family transcriptional regulator n=1 Tax=Cohnella massiliensis TaxID=1816691 RepID=UPI0009BA6B87|nr:TetR/AcrR family transcriptional regulator [Cohnella massiliensis]